MDRKRQGFIEILAELIENDKDLYTLSQNRLKTTRIYKHYHRKLSKTSRIYKDDHRMDWKRQGFKKIFAEWVENDKDL